MEKQVKSVATVLLIPYDEGSARPSRIDNEHEEHKKGKPRELRKNTWQTQDTKGVNDETYLASITRQQTPTGEPPDLTSQTNLTLDETAFFQRPVHRSNRILARKDWLDLLESHTRKSSFYERFISGGGQLGFPHMGKVWGAKLNSQF